MPRRTTSRARSLALQWLIGTPTSSGRSHANATMAQICSGMIVAGAPDGTYLVFSSVASFGEFDKMAADGDATMKNASAEEMTVLGKFMKDSVLSVSTNRYRLDPGQSYVNAETKAQDPAFWSAKK